LHQFITAKVVNRLEGCRVLNKDCIRYEKEHILHGMV